MVDNHVQMVVQSLCRSFLKIFTTQKCLSSTISIFRNVNFIVFLLGICKVYELFAITILLK